MSQQPVGPLRRGPGASNPVAELGLLLLDQALGLSAGAGAEGEGRRRLGGEDEVFETEGEGLAEWGAEGGGGALGPDGVELPGQIGRAHV